MEILPTTQELTYGCYAQIVILLLTRIRVETKVKAEHTEWRDTTLDFLFKYDVVGANPTFSTKCSGSSIGRAAASKTAG